MSLGQFDGRTIRKVRPIPVTAEMSMAELGALFVQKLSKEELDGLDRQALNPDTGFTPCELPHDQRVLPELYLHLATDDCESSTHMGRVCKHTCLAFFDHLNHLASVRGLAAGQDDFRWMEVRKACEGWAVFKRFTPTSWELMTRLFDRSCGMLKSGYLKIWSTVGLATNASLEEEQSNKASFCGHCFSVGCISLPDGKKFPFLLEGTAPMFSLTVNANSPRVTVWKARTSSSDSDSDDEYEKKVMNMPALLTALSGTLLAMGMVINCPNGGFKSGGGWPLDVDITGWLAKTMVTAALDSSPDTHLDFYHRIMYTGWPCTESGQGCMPVQLDESGEIVAGCHPFELNNPDIRGVDANLGAQAFGLMSGIMEEAVPPQAPPEVIQRMANLWIPCNPFETVNKSARREPGVTYNRVVAMESPCAPEYLSIIHEIKRRWVKETNKLNAARDDSDGIVLYSMLEGLSDLVCADVPNKDIARLTVVDSAKQAQINIGWLRRDE
jgi:hypothetical protein